MERVTEQPKFEN